LRNYFLPNNLPKNPAGFFGSGAGAGVAWNGSGFGPFSVTGGWNETGSVGGVTGAGGVETGGCEKPSTEGVAGGTSIFGVGGTGGCAPGVITGCVTSSFSTGRFSSFGCIYPLF
jgi:hypothetical protein